jgi:ABC-type cobalamin/Fe3+-siderophores transport system ATPase subunit
MLGPWDAGKTTLLERLSITTGSEAIVTRDGKRAMLHKLESSRDLSIVPCLIFQIERGLEGEYQVRGLQ